MTIEEELKKWVKTLTPSEKRFVNLIGKARAGSGSQLLDLFDWLNKAGEEDVIPFKSSFRTNLPTLSGRLRELILDSLRLLNKESSVDASMRTALDEIAVMHSKKHDLAAARQLRKTKKTAYETSRYTYVLQCIETELNLVSKLPPDQVSKTFSDLRQEEKEVLKKHQDLRELRFRHDSLLALAQQFSFSRNPEIISRARELAEAPLVLEQLHSEQYLENALAVNTLGLLDFVLRNPEPAIERYRVLLGKWKTKEKWQSDQPDLLMSVCKNYQNVCFYSSVDPNLIQADLSSLKGFNGLPAEKLRAFRETLLHHKFILSLNSGRLDTAISLIPEIEDWLKSESGHLSETQILPFLCNFSVAEFLTENFSEANKYLNRILNQSNRKARMDIREFAIVLQPVIQYELGNTSLNEYLTRSGKRHFTKNEKEDNFELLVLRNIELLLNASNEKAKHKIFESFIVQLEKLNEENAGKVSLLGLNEIYMWAVSRKNNISLNEVFAEELRKAHAAAE